jgi:hypothetical protein
MWRQKERLEVEQMVWRKDEAVGEVEFKVNSDAIRETRQSRLVASSYLSVPNEDC